MQHKHWILDENGEPKEVDVRTWGTWFENAAARRVAEDSLANGVRVSTVFLGLDHNFESSGRPLLWETMIFGGEHDQEQWRYSTRDDALAGHKAAVKVAKEKSA